LSSWLARRVALSLAPPSRATKHNNARGEEALARAEPHKASTTAAATGQQQQRRRQQQSAADKPVKSLNAKHHRRARIWLGVRVLITRHWMRSADISSDGDDHTMCGSPPRT
jgi:hypothetical protein